MMEVLGYSGHLLLLDCVVVRARSNHVLDVAKLIVRHIHRRQVPEVVYLQVALLHCLQFSRPSDTISWQELVDIVVQRRVPHLRVKLKQLLGPWRHLGVNALSPLFDSAGEATWSWNRPYNG